MIPPRLLFVLRISKNGLIFPVSFTICLFVARGTNTWMSEVRAVGQWAVNEKRYLLHSIASSTVNESSSAYRWWTSHGSIFWQHPRKHFLVFSKRTFPPEPILRQRKLVIYKFMRFQKKLFGGLWKHLINGLSKK